MQSTMMQRHCISTSNASSQRMLSKSSSLAGKPLVGCTPLPVRSARTTMRVAADKDPFKEASLKQRRTYYEFDNWKHHRAGSRYTRNLLSVFDSDILKSLGIPLVASTAIATATTVYMKLLQAGELPAGFPDITLDVAGGIGPSAFALSLLLVFRTNSSYGRFQEVRSFFAGTTQRIRDLGRQATIFFGPDQKEQLDLFTRWARAFPISMMVHLRPGEDLRKELKDVLKPEELDLLEASPHRPNTVLMMMSEVVKRTNLTPVQRFRMDENITSFSDFLGASERILRTPLPLSYTRHTTRFLFLWLTFLPLSIYKLCGWATIPTTLIIAFVLLGIEEIGVIKEEPFSVLPLEKYTKEVEKDVRDMVELVRGVLTCQRPATSLPQGPVTVGLKPKTTARV